jgi:hypothetical protein
MDAMPLYFFHLRTAQGLSPDGLGIELPDVETAYLEAFRAAEDMWSDLLKQRKDPTRYTFEITNCLGQMIQTLPFSEVLDSTKGHVMRRKLPHPARTAHELADRTRCLAAALDEQVRLACESIRRSQELLNASRSSLPMVGRPRRTHSGGRLWSFVWYNPGSGGCRHAEPAHSQAGEVHQAFRG